MMFNNPHFQNQIQDQTGDTIKSSQSSVKGRLSVQEVLDKYEGMINENNFFQKNKAKNSIGGQGARFTFQTGQQAQVQSPDRQTFGNTGNYKFQQALKNGEAPQTNAQLLKSIDESNLSKVLSEFSIVSEAQDDSRIQNNQFVNPIGMANNYSNQISEKGKEKPRSTQQERVTFGEGFANQFVITQPQVQNVQMQKQTPLLLQNKLFTDTQAVSMHAKNDDTYSYIGEDELYDDMSVLRDKVLGLLQAYSHDIKGNQNLKDVRNTVQQDATKIAMQYSQIVDRVNQTDLSALTNLSFESQISSNQNPKKEEELNMMFNLVEEFLQKFDSGRKDPLNYSRLIEQKKVVHQSNKPSIETNQFQFKSQESGSLQFSKSINQQQQQSLDLTILPSFPQTDDSFYNHQNIPIDKLKLKLTKLKDALIYELESGNLPHTKAILTEMVQHLNDILTTHDIQTIKTVVYRIEMGIKTLNLQDQGSVKLYNYMAKAIKVTNKRIENFPVPVALNQPSNDSLKQLKRRFFDSALKAKNVLPPNHPSRQLMVSILFDEFILKGYSENQMDQFIQEKIYN